MVLRKQSDRFRESAKSNEKKLQSVSDTIQTSNNNIKFTREEISLVESEKMEQLAEISKVAEQLRREEEETLAHDEKVEQVLETQKNFAAKLESIKEELIRIKRHTAEATENVEGATKIIKEQELKGSLRFSLNLRRPQAVVSLLRSLISETKVQVEEARDFQKSLERQISSRKLEAGELLCKLQEKSRDVKELEQSYEKMCSEREKLRKRCEQVRKELEEVASQVREYCTFFPRLTENSGRGKAWPEG